MIEQFINGWWQIDNVPPIEGRHQLQPRQLGNWVIYNSVSPNDHNIEAYNTVTGERITAPFFGGKNCYTSDGTSIILVSAFVNPTNYVIKRKDLLGVIFNSSTKQFLTVNPCLITPNVLNKCLWIKVGSNNGIVGAPPNDIGGDIQGEPIFNSNILQWDTVEATLQPNFQYIYNYSSWKRQINFDGSMGPIEVR